MKFRYFKIVFAGLCMFALAYRGSFHALHPSQHANMLVWVSLIVFAAAAAAIALGMKPGKSKRFTVWCDVAYMLALIIGVSVNW